MKFTTKAQRRTAEARQRAARVQRVEAIRADPLGTFDTAFKTLAIQHGVKAAWIGDAGNSADEENVNLRVGGDLQILELVVPAFSMYAEAQGGSPLGEVAE